MNEAALPFRDLQAENDLLRARLADAEALVQAIRSGAIDALVMDGGGGERILTLHGADPAYRMLVETMNEAAITLAADGTILFCNQRAPRLLGLPPSAMLGASFFQFVSAADLALFDALLARGAAGESKGEIQLRTAEGEALPAYLSLSSLREQALAAVCLVITDLTEQKRSQELLATERLTRSILEQAAEAILVCDGQGVVLRSSLGLGELCIGNPILRPFDELFTLTLRDPPSDGARQDRRLRFADLRGKTLHGVQVGCLRSDGATFDLLLSVGWLAGDTPAHIGCVVTLTNITEHQRTEDQLRAAKSLLESSERRYRTLAESMPLIVWTARADGWFDYCNQWWSDYTGIGLEQARGSGWQAALHPDDRRQARAAWKRSIATGQPLELECRLRRASDGSYRWHLGRALPVREPDGRIVQWIGSCTDIEEQQRSQRDLRFLLDASAQLSSSLDYQQTLATVVRLSVPGFADWSFIDLGDGSGALERLEVAHADSAHAALALEVKGCVPRAGSATPQGRAIRDRQPLLVADLAPGALDQLVDDAGQLPALRAIRPRSLIVVPLVARGRAIGALTFLVGESGRRYGDSHLALASDLANRVAVAVDNARLYAAEQAALRDSARTALELRASNAELEQFAYVASHDLQEPLRMVTSYLALLECRYAHQLDAKAREFIGIAVGGATRMHNLIRALLTYSQIDRSMACEFALVDTHQVLHEALDNLRAQITDSGAVVSCPAMPEIVADRVQLMQLFQNLVANAIKFARGRPEVSISAGRGSAGWEFRVRDNGIGIEPQHRGRLFELFHRLHTQAEYPGTGIGLATCRKIVERHGGRIWVESTPGVGSTFCFTLPERAPFQPSGVAD